MEEEEEEERKEEKLRRRKNPLSKISPSERRGVQHSNFERRGLQSENLKLKDHEQKGRELQQYGPYWDTVLGYWQASKQEPERVLFLHYEELKQEPSPQVKKLASFLGVPFTEEEEEKGVVEDIINLCSFDKMSNLEVNKTGKSPTAVPAQVFFRSGSVGDWSKYLTSEMVERLNSITQEKMKGSGLDLIL